MTLFRETPCETCEQFHQEPLLLEGADPVASIGYCYERGSRVEVTIDQFTEAIKGVWLVSEDYFDVDKAWAALGGTQ